MTFAMQNDEGIKHMITIDPTTGDVIIVRTNPKVSSVKLEGWAKDMTIAEFSKRINKIIDLYHDLWQVLAE